MSPLSFPPLVITLVFLFLGFFVLSRSPKSRINQLFALNCLTTAHWQGTWAVLFSTINSESATVLIRIGYSGIIFIPFTYYHFVAAFTGLGRERSYARLLYFIGGFFLFRFFDIGKFPPMKQLERLHGGWGIMLDDVAAGLISRLVLGLLVGWFPRFFGAG